MYQFLFKNLNKLGFFIISKKSGLNDLASFSLFCSRNNIYVLDLIKFTFFFKKIFYFFEQLANFRIFFFFLIENFKFKNLLFFLTNKYTNILTNFFSFKYEYKKNNFEKKRNIHNYMLNYKYFFNFLKLFDKSRFYFQIFSKFYNSLFFKINYYRIKDSKERLFLKKSIFFFYFLNFEKIKIKNYFDVNVFFYKMINKLVLYFVFFILYKKKNLVKNLFFIFFDQFKKNKKFYFSKKVNVLQNNDLRNKIFLKNRFFIWQSKWIPGALTNYFGLKKTLREKQNLSFLKFKHLPDIIIKLYSENNLIFLNEVVKMRILFLGMTGLEENPFIFNYFLLSNSDAVMISFMYLRFFFEAFFRGLLKEKVNFFNNKF